jgi:hypothetical protein
MIFSCRIPKILVSNNLGCDNRREPAQNIEPLGLTGKIFWNKDLAVTTRKSPPPFGWSNDRTRRLWKARSDVTKPERKLWKLGFVPVLGIGEAAQKGPSIWFHHCARTRLPEVVENSTKFLPLVTVAVAGGSWSLAGSTVETVQGGFTAATGKGRKRTGCQSPQSETVFIGPKDTR